MAAESVTLMQNWGSYFPNSNPNVYPGDINGNPVTPQTGVACHLWANVQNNGTVTVQFVTVTFFLCIPPSGMLLSESTYASNAVWPLAAHGSGSVPSIAAGTTQPVMCSIPWIPDFTISIYQCIVGVVSCLDCQVPSTTPGQPVVLNNNRIGVNTFFMKQ